MQESKPTGSMAYELTDHLGNVRAIVKKQVTEYVATMEDNGQVDLTNPRVQEMQAFDNLVETGVRDVRFNHTKLPNAEWSAYLHWIDGMAGMQAADKAVGPAIALKVDAGDTLNIETWVRYEKKTNFARNVDLALLSSLLGGTFAYNPGFEGSLPSQTASTFQNAIGAGGMFNDNDDTRPFAYLNYILFDKQMNVISQNWVRVTEEAGFWPGEETSPTKKPVQLKFATPVLPAVDGYIYAWVSNSSENSKVWFDDVKVRHVQTIVSQATDYGVWGEVLREQKANSLEQYRYAYQGQFAEKDEETGWNHFELREYDPIIGRWLVPDPYGQYWSPYVAMGNDPVNLVDPDGGCDTGDCPDPTLVNGDASMAAEANRLSELNAGRPDAWTAFWEDMEYYNGSGSVGFFFSGSGGFQDGLLHKGYSAELVFNIDVENDLFIFGIGNGSPTGGSRYKGDKKTPDHQTGNEDLLGRGKNLLTAEDKLKNSKEASDRMNSTHHRMNKREQILHWQDSLKKAYKDNGAFRINPDVVGGDTIGVNFYDSRGNLIPFKLK